MWRRGWRQGAAGGRGFGRRGRPWRGGERQEGEKADIDVAVEVVAVVIFGAGRTVGLGSRRGGALAGGLAAHWEEEGFACGLG
jgi:hypothetical protein